MSDQSSSDPVTDPEILFEQRGRLGLITLNRPKAMNALTYGMVLALDAQLDQWAQDDTIGVVAIQGAGDRAFAAGGDIRWLYDNGQGGATGERNFRFFADEYRAEVAMSRQWRDDYALAVERAANRTDDVVAPPVGAADPAPAPA